MNVFFSSDWHINHQNVCRFREQFENVQQHNEFIFDNYCSVVRPKDKVFLLGDIGFDLDGLKAIKKLPGIKELVVGNHCKEKKRKITMHDLMDTFHDVHGFMRYKDYWLSHCPIHSDELRGRYNVHGHTHNHNIDDPRYFNACLENTDYKPVSLEELRVIFKGKNINV